MGKIKSATIWVSATFVVGAVYFLLRAVGVMRQGYSWQGMDWNQDGATSISEFFATSDVGMRDIIQDGGKCIEYFAYKDGLPVKTVCPK